MKRKSLLFLLLFALIAPWAANAQTLFSEGFEGGSMPTGWTTDGPGTWSVGSGDYSTTTGAGLGTYNALINHSTTGNVTKLITPEIDLSSVTSPTLSFMHVQRSWGSDIDYLKVYYRTSSSGTWTQLVAYTGAVASWTTEEDIVLPNTTATYQLAFEYTDNWGYGVGLDQVVISVPAACPKPTLGAAEYISEEGASFQWTENGSATQWQLQYSTSADFSNPTTIDRNGIPAYAITGLTPSTAYYVHVRSYCGDGEWSDWSNTVNFRTPCTAFGLPYAYGFEDAEDLNCWTVVYTANTPGINTVQAHTGSNCFSFSSYSSASSYDQYLISPMFNATNGIDFSFYYKPYSSGTEVFTVGYSTTTNDASAFTWGDDITTTAGDDWNLYEATYPAGTKYVAIYYHSNYAYYLYVDDFNFEAPSSCRKPTDLATGEVGKRSATIRWTENGEATAWQVEVTDLDGGQVTTWNANATTYEIVGLTPGTRYSVRVNPVCDIEKWSDAITFTTEVACPAPTDLTAVPTPISATLNWEGDANTYTVRYRPIVTLVPLFFDDFESGTLDNWTLVDADGDGNNWNAHINTGTGNYTTHSGDGVAYSESYQNDSKAIINRKMENGAKGALTPDNWMITPQVQLGGSVSFWAIGQDASWCEEHFAIYVSTTGTNPSDFTQISPEYIATGEYVEYSADLGNYSGMGYVAIRHYNVSDMFVLNVDDFGIYPATSVNWIYVNNVNSNSINITDLTPETDYEWQVQAMCGGEDGESLWASSTFTTPSNCEAPSALNVTNLMPTTATLNWTGYQDGYKVRYRTAASVETFFFEGFEGLDQELPEGWTSIDADGDGNGWYGLTGFGDYAHSGDGIVTSASYASSALTPDNWLVTPQIALKGTMKVYLRAQDPSWTGEHYAIYLSTTGNTVADFTTTLVEESSDLTGEYLEITADLSSYNGQLGYIAIRHFNCTDMFRLNVDDFGIYGGEVPAGEWNTVTTGDLFADIIELDPETTYEWQVCGENRSCTNGEEEGYTAWSEMGTFTTPGECDKPINLVAEAQATTATLSWTGYQESFNLQYREAMQVDLFFFEDFSGESISFTFDNFGAANNDFGKASGWYEFTDGTDAIIFFPDTELTSPQYLISYEMEPTISGTTIEFGAAASGTGCVYRIGFSSTDNSISSFTWSDDIAIENSYVEYEVPVGTKYFAIAYPETNPSDVYAYVLDFLVYANYVPAGEWVTVENPTSPVTIEGLNPETEYEWQVQGICDGGETEWVNDYFTTLEQTNITQTTNLNAGWNWFSAYVEGDAVAMIQALENSLGDKGITIKGSEISTDYYGEEYGWFGELDALGIVNEQMYLINVTESCTVELQGTPANPANHAITINPGWNWIGFPCAEAVSVAAALAEFPAEEGDVLKGSELSTDYYGEEFGWFGGLETLEPGQGYLYKYNGTTAQTLIFQTGAKRAATTNTLLLKKQIKDQKHNAISRKTMSTKNGVVYNKFQAKVGYKSIVKNYQQAKLNYKK